MTIDTSNGRARLGVLASTIAAVIAGGTTMSRSVLAQEEAGPVEEITVTGSRIVRRDFVSNSPIVTVDNESFESRSGLNMESYLNQLPNFNPSAAPTIQTGEGGNSDVQISSVRSVGIASVSLRGFGPNRNLVLVNGKRPTPINALMVTDINGIPSALVERVEIITGGASAVYGADAVGGVTNFILRDDFQGFEFDIQNGITEAGDGDEFRVNAVIGANFDDGRGNVAFGAEHYDRKAALEIERDFFTDAWSDPLVGGDLFVFGYNGYNTGFNTPNPAALDAIFGDRPRDQQGNYTTGYQALGPGFLQGFRFNPDGSLFTLQGDNLYKYQGPIDGREYALQRVYDNTIPQQGVEIETLKWNNLEALVSSPQERYSFFASANYDLSDRVTFFSRATWAESKTRTLLLPANASYGWEANIPYDPTTDSPVDPTLDYTDPDVVAAVLANPDNFANPGFIPTGQPGAQHPVPVELAVALNSRANPTDTWIMETYPRTSFLQRQTDNTNTVWQVEGGLRFELPFRDWDGEFYVSHGESSTYNIAGGNNSLSRWRAVVTAPDYGRNALLEGNQPPHSSNPGFGAAEVTCTSGFYDTIFGGDVPPSDDCRYAVEATLQSRTQSQQEIVELNFQGGIAEIGAGEVRAALGLQYRENSAQFYPDILQSTASFGDQVIGVYPTSYMDASTSVMDTYGEVLIPIVPRFELELGARYSDYEHSSNEWTYKALFNAEPNDWMRLRGGYNRATRAPNLGELFLNTQEIFTIGGANFGDPCALRSNAPFGAGGVLPDPVQQPGEPPTELASGQTPEGAMSTYLICRAQMGAGADVFYSQDAGGATGSAFNWVLQEGNPNLESEKADTWTLGFVVTSPFQNRWLSGLTASVDWWQVDIKDAIQQFSVDYARYLCYGTVLVTNEAEAAAQAASPECQNVGRNTANGGADTILIAYDNLATIETSGVDIAVNWFSQLADLGFDRLPGGVGVNMQATWLDYYRTKQSPAAFDVETDWKGSLGPTLSGTNAGAYDYRLFTSFSYFLDNFSVNLRWRHLPSVWGAAYASQQAIIDNNARVAAGGEGVILTYTPTTMIEADSYNVFDLSFNWNFRDTYTLRGGIDNLFNEKPSITGASHGYPVGTDLSSVCAGWVAGCQNPTNYSMPSSGAGTTNGGYYDILGRRFFVGLEVRF